MRERPPRKVRESGQRRPRLHRPGRAARRGGSGRRTVVGVPSVPPSRFCPVRGGAAHPLDVGHDGEVGGGARRRSAPECACLGVPGQGGGGHSRGCCREQEDGCAQSLLYDLELVRDVVAAVRQVFSTQFEALEAGFNQFGVDLDTAFLRRLAEDPLEDWTRRTAGKKVGPFDDLLRDALRDREKFMKLLFGDGAVRPGAEKPKGLTGLVKLFAAIPEWPRSLADRSRDSAAARRDDYRELALFSAEVTRQTALHSAWGWWRRWSAHVSDRIWSPSRSTAPSQSSRLRAGRHSSAERQAPGRTFLPGRSPVRWGERGCPAGPTDGVVTTPVREPGESCPWNGWRRWRWQDWPVSPVRPSVPTSPVARRRRRSVA